MRLSAGHLEQKANFQKFAQCGDVFTDLFVVDHPHKLSWYLWEAMSCGRPLGMHCVDHSFIAQRVDGQLVLIGEPYARQPPSLEERAEFLELSGIEVEPLNTGHGFWFDGTLPLSIRIVDVPKAQEFIRANGYCKYWFDGIGRRPVIPQAWKPRGQSTGKHPEQPISTLG